MEEVDCEGVELTCSSEKTTLKDIHEETIITNLNSQRFVGLRARLRVKSVEPDPVKVSLVLDRGYQSLNSGEPGSLGKVNCRPLVCFGIHNNITRIQPSSSYGIF